MSGLGGGDFARSLPYRSRQLGRKISGLWLAIPGVRRGYCSRRLVRAAQPRPRMEFARMGFRRSVSASKHLEALTFGVFAFEPIESTGNRLSLNQSLGRTSCNFDISVC